MIPGSAAPLLLAQSGEDSYKIDRSLRFNSGDSAYLNRTPSSAGNRKTWTWSGWVKRYSTGIRQIFFSCWTGSTRLNFGYLEDDRFEMGTQFAYILKSNALFRDPAAWQHWVVSVDTTLSSNRCKVYLNGSEITSWNTNSFDSTFAQNADTDINQAAVHYIGQLGTGTSYLNAGLADVQFIDGQALAPTDFGEFDSNNVWQPKEFTGDHNSAAVNYTSISTLAALSGSSLDSSYNDVSKVFDGSGTGVRTVTENSNQGEKLSITFNPPITLSSETVSIDTSSTYQGMFVTVDGSDGSRVSGSDSNTTTLTTGSLSGSLSKITVDNGTDTSGRPASILRIRIGGSTLLNTSAGVNGFHLDFSDNSSNAALGTDSSGNSNTWTVNNLVATAGLETANQGFDAVTYTGNASSQAVSGLQFKPDLVWLKRRDGAGNHNLQDAVRGASAVLQSDYNGAEFTNGPRVSSFDSNGFTLTSDNGGNTSGGTYVAWCWKAGGTASSNDSGSITSSVSANQAYGFSIVTASPAQSAETIGHGLNAAPALIISKSRTVSLDWNVFHKSLGTGQFLRLNTTAVGQSVSNYWGSSVTSTTFGVASGNNGNNNGDMVYYCWSEVPGFSSFGSVSAGSDPVVTTGFKPRFVLLKRTDAAGNWYIFDTARGSGTTQIWLEANSSGAENNHANGQFVFRNDGFQLVGSDIDVGTVVYAAFADKPPGEIIDSLIDTPTNVENNSGNNGGNYCTLNPLDSTLDTRLSDGNLQAVGNNNWATGHTRGTFGLTSGKWYWEVEKIAGGAYAQIGFCNKAFSFSTVYGTLPADSWTLAFHNGTEILRPAGGGANYFSGSAMAVGDVLGIALDMDNKTAIFSKNGTAGASISLSSTKTSSTDNIDEIFPLVGVYSLTAAFNGGQRPFAYTPPSGYKSLCTTNLTDPTIADGSTAFDVALWSGTGSSQTISLGFDPDMIWSKTRNHAVDHKLVDSVRGFTKQVEPNQTIAEYTNSTGVTGTSSTGFTIGSSNDWNNSSSRTYVGWAWDGGTSTVSNTDGSITSSVRANASAGFSIVSYTGNATAGATFGHGLNAVPDMIIIKARDSVADGSWIVGHSAMGLGYARLLLNSTAANNGTPGNVVANDLWNNTAATSSVVSIGSYNAVNDNGDDYIAYCFAPVEGYSAFGSYTGNGQHNNDLGPFIYTGFRPAFIMFKRTDNTGAWEMYDSTRSPENPYKLALVANTSGAEYDVGSYPADMLSNGFKIRHSGANVNASGGTYIYMAFASHPFKTSRAR